MERYRKENDAGEDDKGMKGRREKEEKRKERGERNGPQRKRKGNE